ncbi:hypothetical protein L3Q82_004427 [Scortum barcoo]|uniref:Uncharacterized protein n=1 Tax=Scortum barcoo TaxID=214431 RepID=A0ACB8VK45_9TELE|nr:hypothetical protein L3Q82_004427 [Scortum barcoo]
MRFSSWSWNSGPALYPPQGARGFMGVCPTSPHVLCGSGEGIRPCPSWYSVGSAPLSMGSGAFAKGCSVSVRPEQELGSHCTRQRSQGPEGVRFGNHRISSLLFADDVVLLASSSQDLQHVLERFAAECEAAGMRISTSKSEAMGGVPGVSHREEASGKTQDTLERLCLSDWPGNASGIPPEELEEVSGYAQFSCSSARLLSTELTE